MLKWFCLLGYTRLPFYNIFLPFNCWFYYQLYLKALKVPTIVDIDWCYESCRCGSEAVVFLHVTLDKNLLWIVRNLKKILHSFVSFMTSINDSILIWDELEKKSSRKMPHQQNSYWPFTFGNARCRLRISAWRENRLPVFSDEWIRLCLKDCAKLQDCFITTSQQVLARCRPNESKC